MVEGVLRGSWLLRKALLRLPSELGARRDCGTTWLVEAIKVALWRRFRLLIGRMPLGLPRVTRQPRVLVTLPIVRVDVLGLLEWLAVVDVIIVAVDVVLTLRAVLAVLQLWALPLLVLHYLVVIDASELLWGCCISWKHFCSP